MSGSKQIVVARDYQPSPDAMAHAVALLLKTPCKEKAAEPDGRNDAAIVRATEGVRHVEQQPDRSSEIT